MTEHVEKSDAEWRAELTPEQYKVTRQHGTERAGTSPLNNEKREGVFTCVCCGAPLFSPMPNSSPARAGRASMNR